jgi:hypothetical protein
MVLSTKNGLFSIKRLGQLLLRELTIGYRSLLIAMAAVGGVVVILSVLTTMGVAHASGGMGGPGSDFYLGLFRNLLFLGGFIVTSLAFREVWQNGGGIFYLTLPGSVFEKFLSKLLVTSIGFALGSLLFMAGVTALSELIDHLLFGYGHGYFYMGSLIVAALKACLFYVITQSLFLLGSIWFKKVALIRTALWMGIFAIALAIIVGIATRIFLGSKMNWSGMGFRFNLNNGDFMQMFGPGTRTASGLSAFKIVSQVLFYALAPVCWLATYFKLAEAEV